MRNISPAISSGHANCHSGSVKMHTRSELKCKCCISISGLILTNVRCRIWWGHLSLSLASANSHTQNDVEYWIITWVRPSVNGLSLSSSSQILTALDRDGYCRKHKLRHNWNKPLTWCLAAAEGGDGLDRTGREAFRGLGGRVKTELMESGGPPVSKHPLLVLAEGEAKTLGQSYSKGTTAQHTKPNVFLDQNL